MKQKVLWFDTETTGLDPKKNGMTEIACIVEVDGVVVDEILLFINTESYSMDIEYDAYALKITKKTKEVIFAYPSSSHQFMKFIIFLDKHVHKFDKTDKFIPAGFNVKFDIDMLQAWFLDNGNKFYGSYFSYKDVDNFALVKFMKYQKMFNTKDDKLGTICEYFKIPLDAHNALDDIRATRELTPKLVSLFKG